MAYQRYVALGDSQTEGLNDGDELAGYRGWADRLADLLAAQEPAVRYANLAVRGRLAGQVRAEQLEPALALRPDLVTVMAGMNDLIRPAYDAAAVTEHLEETYAALAATGTRVVTFTFPDIARIAPIVRWLRPRLLDLNERIRNAAARHGAVLVDCFPHAVTVDPRLWSADRIHATPLGHARIAAATAHALALPGSDGSWTEPLPARDPVSVFGRVRRELVWARTFVGPWMLRRLRGRSSGDGHTARRPQLLPVHTSPS